MAKRKTWKNGHLYSVDWLDHSSDDRMWMSNPRRGKAFLMRARGVFTGRYDSRGKHVIVLETNRHVDDPGLDQRFDAWEIVEEAIVKVKHHGKE